MSKKGFSGFTIIETMLFLAVTAVLVVGILAGTGTTINNQRYKDSVYSLQSYLQKQLSEVVNASNDSEGGYQKYECNSSADISKTSSGTISKGQSDCLILGKLITVTPTTGVGTNQIISRTVVGRPNSTPASSSDTDVFKSYKIRVTREGVVPSDKYEIEWSNVLKSASSSGTGADSRLSILIMKSPASGIIRTYIDLTKAVGEGADLVSGPDKLVDGSNLQNEAVLCVKPANGSIYNGEFMAVILRKGASNTSGVEILSNSGGAGC